ncbi:kynurenine 3-monooxygenase [Anoplophora glabripennis]|uniref:kynurenine 3-monooxygenase n=1 Tax=Anoplophora glabripennis TaxID=217634 RepID=UPI00087497BC|nr:kynurenine 3-monooxygenase [Anoplophora glabripennis]
MCDNDKQKIIIVGGGLVGSLCACFMAKRGHEVTLYERREDIRTSKIVTGRSINLALSHRGREALRSVDLELEILNTSIPMRGRLLHTLSGKTTSIPYDPVTKQCIYSVSRNFLNQALLKAAETYPNVKLHFNQKLVRSNFDEGTVTVLNTNTFETSEDTADLIIGADGAFSALRRSMQKTPLFEFSQKYVEHGYLELSIPPERGTLMAPNHLHIWPRGAFMMIALPNQDSSWTVTLFMPFQRFSQLSTREMILGFFKDIFPDSLSLIGERELVETFFEKKPSALVSIKCKPYHVGSRFLIVGDAAHAMVPFYGQGMNAGFEDCSLLNQLLEENNENFPETIRKFSEIRVASAQAICDLAMYNYEEMRNLVTKPTYHMRRALDNVLFKILSDKWIPLYNSISFSHIDYMKCLENRKKQDNSNPNCFQQSDA